MDAFRKLKQLFPGADENTTLQFLGPSTRIKIGRTNVELRPYEVGEDRYIMAAFVEEVNIIFMRFQDVVSVRPRETINEMVKEIIEEEE